MTESEKTRFAMVTGAGSGLGRAFCLNLAAQGWHVACADVDRESAERTLAELQQVGGSGQVELLDVSDPEAWRNLGEKLRGQWPRLDLLVNNAGICASGEIGESDLEDFLRVLDVNLRGVLYGCHTMVPWLRQTAPGGHVVNISSIAGILSGPAMGAYNIAKAGVMSLSETLYAELRPLGVGVTVVLPGFFPTGLLRRGCFANEMHRYTAERYTEKSQFTADDVVRSTIAAIERGRLYVVVGRRARWLWRLKRAASTLVLRVAGKYYRRRLEKFEAGNCTESESR